MAASEGLIKIACPTKPISNHGPTGYINRTRPIQNLLGSIFKTAAANRHANRRFPARK